MFLLLLEVLAILYVAADGVTHAFDHLLTIKYTAGE
jgi:hypothetical protein